MSSNFNFPPPGGAPNANSSATPLRPYYGSPLDASLQSYYSNTLATSQFDLEHENELNSQQAAKELVSYGALKYLTLAIAAPFEAGQTLLQVQYLPDEDDSSAETADATWAADEERRDEEFRRAQQAAEEEEYYNNGSGSGGGYYSSNSRGADLPSPRSNPSKLDPSSAVFREIKAFDQAGYLVQDDVYDDNSRPAFRVAPIEGGQYTNWVYEILHLFAQPTLEATLNDTFDLYDDTIPLVNLDRVGPNMATMITSHLVVGFILSPLELVRTRLVVQTADPKQRKYSGLLNCLSTIISEEGFLALWGGVNFVPTILYHTLTPLFTNSIPLIIDRVFGVSAMDSPMLYALAELGLDTLDLLIRLPLETVRKRLQIQIQAKIPGKRYETVVETRTRPYAGVIDCVKKIIQEEGGVGHKGRSSRRRRRSSTDSDREGSKQQKKTPWYAALGCRGLYTGLGMHLTSNLAIFAVGAVTNLKDDSDDW
ncbi:hypothetical protein BGZ75_004643 [Mortierella antarctica]|nr:hypothetical protein BGZ75_004643 [Mortierella antarctica]